MEKDSTHTTNSTNSINPTTPINTADLQKQFKKYELSDIFLIGSVIPTMLTLTALYLSLWIFALVHFIIFSALFLGGILSRKNSEKNINTLLTNLGKSGGTFDLYVYVASAYEFNLPLSAVKNYRKYLSPRQTRRFDHYLKDAITHLVKLILQYGIPGTFDFNQAVFCPK